MPVIITERILTGCLTGHMWSYLEMLAISMGMRLPLAVRLCSVSLLPPSASFSLLCKTGCLLVIALL